MNDVIGFGIIGSGVIGQTHAEAMQKVAGANLIIVCDKDEKKARNLADKYNVPWCTDYHDIFKNQAVDLVSVCTPTGFHAEPTIAAFESGKHVLVEKPMEIDLNRAEAMVGAAQKARCYLGVIFQYRFLPAIQYLKKAIDSGLMGKITMAEATVKWYRSPEYFRVAPWRGTYEYDGGGALMNQGVHFIDLLLYLLGPVESVMTYFDTLFQPIEVEDTAVVCLRFKNGTLGVVQATTTAFPRLFDRIEIAGTKGSIMIEDGDLRFKYFAEEDGSNVGPFGLKKAGLKVAEKIKLGESLGHITQISDFVTAIKEKRAPIVDGKEGIRSLAVIDAAYRSAKSGTKIVL